MPRIFSARVIFYLLFLLVLELSVLPFFRIGVFQPVLLYLMVLHAAFQWGWEKTVPMAVAVGILRDLTGSHSFGLETVALVAASSLLDLLVQKIERDSQVTKIGIGFLFVFFVSNLVVLFSGFLGRGEGISGYAFWVSAGTAFYSAAILPVFFFVTGRLFHDRMALKQYELFG